MAETTSSTLAALDVGSNTVLMLVAELSAGTVRPLADFMKITRLGRGVDRTGMLDPGAMALTLDAIVEFVEKARALGARKILTAGTAAMRDAHNGSEFIDQVRRRAGVDLQIISGETDAQLNYLAAIRGLKIDPAQAMLTRLDDIHEPAAVGAKLLDGGVDRGRHFGHRRGGARRVCCLRGLRGPWRHQQSLPSRTRSTARCGRTVPKLLRPRRAPAASNQPARRRVST